MTYTYIYIWQGTFCGASYDSPLYVATVEVPMTSTQSLQLPKPNLNHIDGWSIELFLEQSYSIYFIIKQLSINDKKTLLGSLSICFIFWSTTVKVTPNLKISVSNFILMEAHSLEDLSSVYKCDLCDFTGSTCTFAIMVLFFGGSYYLKITTYCTFFSQ